MNWSHINVNLAKFPTRLEISVQMKKEWVDEKHEKNQDGYGLI
jgi:hypothetical protein